MKIPPKLQLPKQQRVLDPFSRQFNNDPHDEKNFFRNLVNVLQKQWEQLARIINGGISFGSTVGDGPVWKCDNIDAVHGLAIIGIANVDVVITHQLGRVPTGYIIVGTSTNGTAYTGAGAWTATQMYLRFTAAGTYKLLIY